VHPAAEPVAEPAQNVPSAPAPSQIPSPPEPTLAQDQAPMVPPPGMQKLGQALAEAAQAAGEAGNQGANDCERAYNGAVAMGRALHERMGGTGEAPAPDRARFLAGCARLPANVQRCMNVAYSVQHQDECRRLREEVDPALMREVQSLMGAGD
jgi:hypothetical protein